MNFEIQASPTGNLGCYATKSFKKDETIKVLSGEIVSSEEIDRRIAAGLEKRDDPLQIGKGTYLDLDYESYYFNHSCQPNCGLRGQSELFALKNIRQGEELTYDYSTAVGQDSPNWAMKCRCGSKTCRKTIGNVFSLPPKTLARYYRLDALQDFIVEELKLLAHTPSGSVR